VKPSEEYEHVMLQLGFRVSFRKGSLDARVLEQELRSRLQPVLDWARAEARRADAFLRALWGDATAELPTGYRKLIGRLYWRCY